MPKERIFITDHPDKVIGSEVHVDGWGPGPFFTVREIKDGIAMLSKRYTRRIKYRIPARRCYFTNSRATRIRNQLSKESTNAKAK